MSSSNELEVSQLNLNNFNWLHITGLPSETTNEDILNLLKGYKVDAIKLFLLIFF